MLNKTVESTVFLYDIFVTKMNKNSKKRWKNIVEIAHNTEIVLKMVQVLNVFDFFNNIGPTSADSLFTIKMEVDYEH